MSVRQKYGVVLIGCGCVARYGHLPAIVRNKRVILKGVVDIKPRKAEEYAKKFNAESWGTDYKGYLSRDDVNIVVVTTSPSTHLRIVVDSLRAGKHVLCEKPMVLNLRDADKIVKAVERTKRKLIIGYILRANHAYCKVHEIISKGEIGFPLVMRMQGAEHYDAEFDWKRALGFIKESSPLIDCGVHYVDIMRWVTGSEVTGVCGLSNRLNEDVPKGNYDYGAILIKFRDNSTGFYEVGWGYSMRGFSVKEFTGPKGYINISYGSPGVIDKIEVFTRGKGLKNISVDAPVKMFDAQFDNFLRNIEKDIDPMPHLMDAIASLKIVLAGDKSIRTGRMVYLE